ncbi:hypothetical protein [Anaeromyxobacter paludicola]|uniref:Uncharacterized protein n=1 Tax=Anaeromyxobacter paludicola TaxID=2918171 RepID=A0ABM7XA51_9BACT|nr:hypothetical protein [Anaeromyxobacter paludicola]BDG08723.1 hypothetical protein AMPC_18360 [Anaeromyxobacter paludicola]
MRAPPLCLAAAVAVLPSLALAGPAPAEAPAGRSASGPATGRTIRTPEGFLRVEEPEEPGPGGTLSIVPAAEPARPPAAPQPGVGEAEGRTQPPPAPSALPRRPRGMGLCEPERAAFLKELFRIAGVDVEDPLALVAAFTGENAGDVPSLRFPEWGLVPVDPVRALAWNFELQIRARELSQCVRDPGRPRVDPRFHPRPAEGASPAPSSAPASPPAPEAPGTLVARRP